jgi:hypothetical protein
MSNAEPETTAAKPRGSLLGRLFIASFMGCVVAAECMFAYFWLPSATEVAAQVEQIAKEAKESFEANQEDEREKATPAVEVDLGKFTITNHRLPTETTFRTDFHLYGTVGEEEKEEFEKLFARNEHRFRDQVIVEIRDCEIKDLESPGLGLIKRRFLEKSNALLGKPLLRSIIFADYTFVEL